MLGLTGLVMAIRPGESACYRCAFPRRRRSAPSCAEAGVLGPAAGVIGSLQALEALKLLGGLAAPLPTRSSRSTSPTHDDPARRTSRRRRDCPDCCQPPER